MNFKFSFSHFPFDFCNLLFELASGLVFIHNLLLMATERLVPFSEEESKRVAVVVHVKKVGFGRFLMEHSMPIHVYVPPRNRV